MQFQSITDMSAMFLETIQWGYLFVGCQQCELELYVPLLGVGCHGWQHGVYVFAMPLMGISKWEVGSVTDMSWMFFIAD